MGTIVVWKPDFPYKASDPLLDNFIQFTGRKSSALYDSWVTNTIQFTGRKSSALYDSWVTNTNHVCT
jgi:hypothetical protein